MADQPPDQSGRGLRVLGERHPVFVSLRELFSASVTWWFSWGAFVPTLVAGALFVFLRIVPSASSSAHRDSLGVSVAAGVVLALLANFHRVRQERDRARQCAVDPDHRDRLFELIRGAGNMSVDQSGLMAFGDPAPPRPQPNRAMIEAHFPAIVAIVDRRHEVARRNAEAPPLFRARVDRAIRAEGAFPADIYSQRTLIENVSKLLEDADDVDALDTTFGEAGLWSYHEQSGTVCVSLRRTSAVAQYSSIACQVRHDEAPEQVAEALAEPVNALFVEAWSWPEAVEMRAARAAVDALPAFDLFDEVRAELAKSQVFPAVACKNCQATHGLRPPRTDAPVRVRDRVIGGYRAACEWQDEIEREAPSGSLP